jgi:oxygen-independent coproporphyrinogen-3 oxidase
MSAGDLAAPDSAELADVAATWKSGYVHIPFCRSRCPYCDFAVVTPDEGGTPEVVDRYVAAVLAEIDMEPDGFGPLDAVNLGGGTPSAMAPADLERILDRLANRHGLRPGAEISIEANPEDIDADTARALCVVGFNRLSLGVQSLDGAVLQSLGRAHDARQALDAVGAARRAGFGSVSIDLIFGTPGESIGEWRTTVDQALAAEPDHLSAYALTVERGTDLSRAVLAGAPAPDPDDLADKYELLDEALAAVGVTRYEVSNFARPGHPCRYNLATWAQGEYLGFGLGAHDHRGGIRRRNVRRLDVYLERVGRREPPESGREVLDGWAAEQERVMLGLRRGAGVVAGPAGRALLRSAAGERLASAGVVVVRGDRLVVARPLLTDAAARAVVALPPPAGWE